VVEEVKVDEVVVLPKGAPAIANVTDAGHKRTMGRAGKLNISISYARLADQEKVALRAVKDTKGGGHVGAMTGAMVATAIVFFPAAPLFLFVHGKDVTIHQGAEITAFVEGDMHLNMVRFGVLPQRLLSKLHPFRPTSSSSPHRPEQISRSMAGSSVTHRPLSASRPVATRSPSRRTVLRHGPAS